jgi:hypothetical protein
LIAYFLIVIIHIIFISWISRLRVMPDKKPVKKVDMRLKTSDISPTSQIHAVQTQSAQTFYQLMANDLKTFLVSDPAYTNRYVMFDIMPRLDPELQVAVQMIVYTVINSYEGIDFDDENYVASDSEFLDNVKQILAECHFSTLLPDIIKYLVRDGDVIWRVHRLGEPGSLIKELELLPTYAVTIVDSKFKSDPEKYPVIRDREIYLVSEQATDDPSRPSLLPKLVTDSTSPVSQSMFSTGTLKNKVGKALETLDPEEILHFSLGSTGNFQKDIFARDTFGIWGVSPMESLVFILKLKIACNLDYLRWSRTGLPRWDASLDLTEVMNLQNYQGSNMERLKQARDKASEIFDDFKRRLYYVDDDPASPTYGQEQPIETDHMWIHGTNVALEQKGGIAAETKYLEVVKKCDMSICAALGVPLSLFGYEAGSTYAIGYVTKQFMSSFGGGLLKCVESTIEDFLRDEMKTRSMNYLEEDFDHLILKFKVDDTEVLKAQMEVDRGKSEIITSAWEKGLITKNEAREELGWDPIGPEGDVFKTEPTPADLFGGLPGMGGAPGQEPGQPESAPGQESGQPAQGKGEVAPGKDKKEMAPGEGEEAPPKGHMIDYLSDGQLHHHAAPGGLEDLGSPLAPVELKLETDLIKDYNAAVEKFAENAIKLLDDIQAQGAGT